MNQTPTPTGSLRAFLDQHDAVAEVRVVRVQGSAPRGEGTRMHVAPGEVHGTIGGGRLEHMAIAEARGMLAEGRDAAGMDLPLGPEIGQCCGGRVHLAIHRMNAAKREQASEDEARAEAQRPLVLIFGAGHVGRALARALSPLPFRVALVDARAEELALAKTLVDLRHTPLPEAEIRAAPPGTAYVILTHDHALDFLLTAEALGRGDAAYVGLIGSATKRARFESFARDQGVATTGLTCPIGAGGSADKRPELIAAFAAAEIAAALSR